MRGPAQQGDAYADDGLGLIRVAHGLFSPFEVEAIPSGLHMHLIQYLAMCNRKYFFSFMLGIAAYQEASQRRHRAWVEEQDPNRR